MSSINENYEKLKSTYELITKDFEKFLLKDTKAAGVRVKSNILECVKLCNTLEGQIMEKVKNIPSKHRSDLCSEVEKTELSISHKLTEAEAEDVDIEKPSLKKSRKPRRANLPKSN